ncbi:MAG: hypothetical protein B7Y25_07290 [Alphaproteobacteria bacterium 16-39-46]|nr:MAG: hypothetical protein B7Y25_07290 [Alphaproteobacteria bacterium 16-39-46]OZA41764.1 MAG: hypothetical protein B7X84_07410 [Alphaproteobacteria bacterium 17-39-52]HQS84713.1 IS110 family transposase [Alphaproteobacteria bacterium]HQS94534.1 IS110 family transposase [Alphaproteobacteria bacterium]
MKYYAGLDVSLKETFLSIVNETGQVVKEGFALSDLESLSTFLKESGFKYEKAGIESGQLSISLCKGLSKKGFPMVCVDARHMAAVLKAQAINKNDRNDGRGIAQMMRVGLYKEVQIKSDRSCEEKIILGSRRQLVKNRQQLMLTIRGLLKIYGIKIGTQSQFSIKVRGAIEDLSQDVILSMEGLLKALEAIDVSLQDITKKLIEIGKKDEDCLLLMTVPGVGTITAMTYKGVLDDPKRFENSETVGAYLGLTPRQYSSGETNRHGSISKMGPKECRNLLYESAFVFLTRSNTSSKLKKWGLKLVKKKGMKKAVVAVARKLSVIMHRMLIERKEFCHK